MELLIDSVGQSLTIDIIKKFEQETKLSLPEDYVNFLLKNNGGTPNRPKVVLEDDTTFTISYFNTLQVDKERVHGVELLCAYYLFSEDADGEGPSYMLPIAQDYGGNELLLSTQDNGSVYVWYHDLGISYQESINGNELGLKNFIKVSDSFTELLDSLQEYPELQEDEILESINPDSCDALQRLLKDGLDPNYVDPDCQMSLIELAAGSGSLETVKLLIENGADVNKTKLGILQAAVNHFSGDTDILEYLLRLDVDINNKNIWDERPIDCTRFDSYKECLIKHGAEL